jgi:hypothetical protein
MEQICQKLRQRYKGQVVWSNTADEPFNCFVIEDVTLTTYKTEFRFCFHYRTVTTVAAFHQLNGTAHNIEYQHLKRELYYYFNIDGFVQRWRFGLWKTLWRRILGFLLFLT